MNLIPLRKITQKYHSKKKINEGLKNNNFKYTVAQITISIKCFLNSSVGFRALANIFKTLQESVINLGTPVYTTIRMWFCKLGLYKLNQSKCKSSKYFHIVDVSIQMGRQKFVVILGVKQQDLLENFSPTLKEVEVLVLRPLESCKGEIIKDLLKEATEKTGIPLGIISDGGSDLKKGTSLFLEEVEGEKPVHLNDCSHKLNNFLKHELDEDPIWLGFKKAAGEAVQHLKLSPIGHLSPPRRRIKERMHNSFSTIEWGLLLLSYLKSDEAKKLPEDQLIKIIWVKEYEPSLIIYKHLMEICKKALDLVHHRGYYRWIAYEFAESMDSNYYANLRCFSFYKRVEAFFAEEGAKIPDGQHYLGSSEILESLFGKFKYLEDHHSNSGLTSLILAVPALTGRIDETIIYDAMNEVSTNDQNEWVVKNMGPTFLSKRRQALRSNVQKFDFSQVKADEEDLEYCEKTEVFAAQN